MKLFLLMALMLIWGCSYQSSRNRVSETTTSFDGGIYNQKQWDESLEFKRVSWYTGATLSYDMLITTLSPESEFRRWLSEGELGLTNRCNKLHIALIYSNAMDARSTVTISSQIVKMGNKRVTLPVFSRHLKGHPTFADRNLDQHRILGFCQLSSLPKSTKVIEVPGFISTELNL